MLSRPILALIATFVLSACRLDITVPRGGEVVSTDGQYRCYLEAPCQVPANTPDVSLTFQAIPDDGWEFVSWWYDSGFWCAGQTGDCLFETTWAKGVPEWEFMLTNDATLSLRPVFVPKEVGITELELEIHETVTWSVQGEPLWPSPESAKCYQEGPIGVPHIFTEEWTFDPKKGVFYIDGNEVGAFHYQTTGNHIFRAKIDEREYWCGPQAEDNACGDPSTIIWQDTTATMVGTYDAGNTHTTIRGRIDGKHVARTNVHDRKSECPLTIEFFGTVLRGTERF